MEQGALKCTPKKWYSIFNDTDAGTLKWYLGNDSCFFLNNTTSTDTNQNLLL